MAEAIFIGASVGVATNLLTDLVNPLLNVTGTAVRCQEECRKLEVQITSIQSGVQYIREQLQELEYYNPTANQDLKIVVDWLEKLKGELHLASIEVHKSNTASRLRIKFFDYRLSKKITAHNVKVTELAKELVPVNLHLATMLNAARAKCPSIVRQQWNREKNDILLREESTRLSEHSVHSGYGSSAPAYYAGDSSQHSSHQ